MIKKICKILMVVFMVVGICISISNLLSVELDALRSEKESYDPGLNDCIGPPGSC
jgi:hypothetical protein